MDHLNNNILCSFYLETKKDKSGEDCLSKVEVRPLTITLETHPNYRPFMVDIEVHGISDGIPGSDAADMFDSWATEFRFPPNKRISPLGFNWTKERPLLLDWLGNATYECFIDGRVRDFTAAHTYQCDKIYRKEGLVLVNTPQPVCAKDTTYYYRNLINRLFDKVDKTDSNDTICVIDTETSGLNPNKHEIIQLCILPVDSAWIVRRDIIPVDIEIRPRGEIDPEAMKATKLDIMRIMQEGLDSDIAQDLIDTWFDKLHNLDYNKITPLAHNWTFDSTFLKKLFGVKYNEFFHDNCRDTMSAVLLENDIAFNNSMRIPFPKVNLPYVAAQLRVEHERSHTALGDCLATLEVYKELIKGRLPLGADSLLGALAEQRENERNEKLYLE